jgi:hypothetical protein
MLGAKRLAGRSLSHPLSRSTDIQGTSPPPPQRYEARPCIGMPFLPPFQTLPNAGHPFAVRGAVADIVIKREQPTSFNSERFLVVQTLIVSPTVFAVAPRGQRYFSSRERLRRAKQLGRAPHSAREEPFFIFVEPDRGPLRLVTLCHGDRHDVPPNIGPRTGLRNIGAARSGNCCLRNSIVMNTHHATELT